MDLDSRNEKPPQDRLTVMRVADYHLYWLGGALAAVSSQMTDVVAGWELYDRTHQPISPGIRGLMGAFPVICLALPAGIIADRFNRNVRANGDCPLFGAVVRGIVFEIAL